MSPARAHMSSRPEPISLSLPESRAERRAKIPTAALIDRGRSDPCSTYGGRPPRLRSRSWSRYSCRSASWLRPLGLRLLVEVQPVADLGDQIAHGTSVCPFRDLRLGGLGGWVGAGRLRRIGRSRRLVVPSRGDAGNGHAADGACSLRRRTAFWCGDHVAARLRRVGERGLGPQSFTQAATIVIASSI